MFLTTILSTRKGIDVEQPVSNLWLAENMFQLGGVRFGDYTLGRTTVHSPIYIDPRVLVSNPHSLRAAAQLIAQETSSGQAMRHPKIRPFTLVAGVPFGGLHLATAFSLATDVPMIYARSEAGEHRIEGRYAAGETVLIIDDLITSGGSILETAAILQEAGLIVRDAIVLVDRDQGGAARLKRHGYTLYPILRLEVMLNLYMSKQFITEDQYRRSLEYIRTHRTAEALEETSS